MKIENVYMLINKELKYMQENHKPYNSYHEGYAVIKEELEELWDEIKKKKPESMALVEEAIQVAATAIRFCTDLLL